MSEYQYYEFAAVDQPLSKQQQAELRALSSRATITASGFRNEYHWGDLKGDPSDWMQRYFDAHVYSASWSSCSFVLRLPKSALDPAALACYTAGGGSAFSARVGKAHCILDWSFHDDGDDAWDNQRFAMEEDGPGWMTRLLPLREELLRGDMRPLYLGWLARLCSCELDDDEEEPPVPAGLRQLSPAQEALAEFLLLDPDLLEVAASGSADLPTRRDTVRSAQAWAAQLSAADLCAAMVQLVTGQGRDVERDMRALHVAWQSKRAASGVAPAAVRSVAQIEAGRGAVEQARLQRERAAQARQLAREQAQREQHLAKVAAQADAIWREIDGLLLGGTGTAYGKAEATLKELAQAMAAAGRGDDFRRGMAALQAAHGHRPAWVKRVAKAGLL